MFFKIILVVGFTLFLFSSPPLAKEPLTGQNGEVTAGDSAPAVFQNRRREAEQQRLKNENLNRSSERTMQSALRRALLDHRDVDHARDLLEKNRRFDRSSPRRHDEIRRRLDGQWLEQRTELRRLEDRQRFSRAAGRRNLRYWTTK